jgi:hypothetical protein
MSLQPAAQEAQQGWGWASRWRGRQWPADEGRQARETGGLHGVTSVQMGRWLRDVIDSSENGAV